MNNECIVVANELTPSETVLLDKEKVLGFVTKEGTRTSHVAIVAKSMNIPSVSAINVFDEIQQDDEIAIDGIKGYVYVNPDEKIKTEIAMKAHMYNEQKEIMKKYIGEKTCIPNGREIKLFANIGSHEDAKIAKENDAEGIGSLEQNFYT